MSRCHFIATFSCFFLLFFFYCAVTEDQFAIALANRSAALYHLEKFSLALSDIELAEKGYPKENMYKLKERAARCHLANKNLEQAMKAFQYVYEQFSRQFTFSDKLYKF